MVDLIASLYAHPPPSPFRPAVVLLGVLCVCVLFVPRIASQRVSLWVTTGGQLTRDRAVRLEWTTAPNDTREAVCYVGAEGLLPAEQAPSDAGAYPLLCLALAPAQTPPPTSLLDRFEEAGGALLPFFQTRWASARLRVTPTTHSRACALAVGDLLCAAHFGADFAWATQPRGLWAYCGDPPEPSGTRVLVRLDAPAAPPDAAQLAACAGAPRLVPVDECWDDNPCADPRDCFDQRRTLNASATCGSAGPVEPLRTSVFNQCVRLIGNDFCVDLYAGTAAPNATDDGDCAFGAKVTRNGELVFEREIDVGVAPFACARFQTPAVPDAVCETCVELRDIEHYAVDRATGQPRNARACVELAVACNGVPLARAQAGCVESVALTRCEQSLERRDNATAAAGGDPPNSVCARPTPLSPRICLQLQQSNASCEFVASLRADNETVLSRALFADDLLSVENRTDALATALRPRTLCVNDRRLPCQSCIEWRPNYAHANDTPNPTDAGIVTWSACASLNVTCLEETVVDTELGCFQDQPVPQRCFDACQSKADCGAHGAACERGLCVCDATWHGARCSYQCPKDCSGAARGVCLPTGVCACIPPATGADCAGNLLGISLQPAPTRRSGNNSVDNNPADRAPATLTNCPSDCNRQGDCVRGQCACFTGFGGGACELAVGDGWSGGEIALVVLTIVMAILVVAVIVYAAYVVKERAAASSYARLSEDDRHEAEAAGALGASGARNSGESAHNESEMVATTQRSRSKKANK
jgi:hypothetical protein